MPVVMLTVIMAMIAVIASLFIFVAWDRIPATKWFAGAVVLLFAGLIAAAMMHMRAARGDITEGAAHIKTGRAVKKRTGGRGSTWYYVTLDGVGEVEVLREQYDAVAIGSAYTVSYSPRVHRAWTVERV